MAQIETLEEQLRKIGCNFRFWGRSELRELALILLPGETIEHCVNGIYEGGFAMLAATNQRLLLIDKKPLYLTLEDIRFDMIAEINYNHRLLDASLKIFTPNKSFRFTAFNQTRLRNMYNFIQHSIMQLRQQYMQMAQPEQREQYVSYASNVVQPSRVIQLARDAATHLPHPQLTSLQGISPAQIGVAGMRRVVPVVGAYTRGSMMSKQRRFLGSY